MTMTCPQWCDLPEGHASPDHSDDREHMSRGTDFYLGVDGDLLTQLYLSQHVTETEPTIRISLRDSTGEVPVTFPQARLVAEALLAMCGEPSGDVGSS